MNQICIQLFMIEEIFNKRNIGRLKKKALFVYDISCINKILYLTIHYTSNYNVSFPHHIWLPFIYKTQSDKVAF